VTQVPVDALIQHWQDRIPFNRLCGFVISRWDERGVRMEIDERDELTNGIGAMHGGVVATLIDTAANAAAITVGAFERGTRVMTVSMTVHYTGPARGHLVADATCTARGRSLRSVAVEVCDQAGAPVASGLVVVKVSPP
jgi:uncharacterized protein (TIGR00369 family)